jgi:cell division transport system permease protein
MSLGTDLKRIIRSGFTSFSRNTLVSLVSIVTMSVTLLVIGLLLFAQVIMQFSLNEIQNRVDVNVYFFSSAQEAQIFELRDLLAAHPDVLDVQYVSKEEVLENFVARHSNDSLTLQSLEELGENPLGAVLNIRARDASRYDEIAAFLESDVIARRGLQSSIENINFYQNRELIERLNSIIRTVRTFGFAVTLFFIIISVLITLTTIRLTIYVSREEIAIMRLVGAENKYIQGPFMVEGILYGTIAALLSMGILYPLTLWITRIASDFFGGFSLVGYYLDNFLQIFIILLVIGFILGALASILAIRNYLRK